MNKIIIILTALFFVACSDKKNNAPALATNPTEQELPSPQPSPVPTPTPTPIGGIAYCSNFSFSDVSWPNELTNIEADTYAIALNITSSFEGNDNWQTIANNFDGQGMSLGLLGFNFGTGTLQPQLVEMQQKAPNQFASYFSSADYASLIDMLQNWSGSSLGNLRMSRILFPTQSALSPLDINTDSPSASVYATPAEAHSVSWAVANLYQANGSFLNDWKNSFQAMADSATYRSIQLEAAASYFDRAVAYYNTFQFHELRSLLLLFDFTVQNGGFNSSHQAQYAAYLANNPNASETEKEMELLTIRLTTTNPKYVADVRSRKLAIINGTGVVHGASRNLPSEYCYDPGYLLQP